MSLIELSKIIDEELAGLRLDQALSKMFPQFSRSQMQNWIESGQVTIDNKVVIKNRERVFPGQHIHLSVTLEDNKDWQPEAIPLHIIYEDDSLFVINKPPGLVVHPGAGNPKSTLVNALLHYDPGLNKIPRAGLIHRLDKDTSGILLVARTLEAHHHLSDQMQLREIHRTYEAIVNGHPRISGTISLPIGRHPTQRTKMAVLTHGGKPAKTHYHVLEKFIAHSYVKIDIETGRTHQIRVHLAHINHPIVGDQAYGKPSNLTLLSEAAREQIRMFRRQALHAKKISFLHPNGQWQTFETESPPDFKKLLEALREG